MKLNENGKVTLTKQEEEFLIDLLANTGLEIWGGSCNHRIRTDYSDDGVQVCGYYSPMHGKNYKTVQGAINYVLKEEGQY